MPTQEVKRKLSAILSADVKGYSRLTGEDEVSTLNTLSSYFQLMTDRIQQNRGRVVNTAGDALLAEFASVVDAVQCAVEVQKELGARNADLPENRRMEFRIGINLGDVIEKEDTIYGDGVNIAARVQGLADGGGICISGTTYDHVKNKVALGYESLGEQTVKNIVEPVRVYRVLMEPGVTVSRVAAEKKARPRQWQRLVAFLGIVLIVVIAAFSIWELYLRPNPPSREVGSEPKTILPLPDQPSIAVLPFVNMSGDPKQEFLCDAMTEEIISALSKVPRLFVIARNSTFTYKGKPVKVKQVSEELGVRYVLEGSLQRSGDRVRITAQLIDALTGNHLWAESYDRDLKDRFAVQDEITLKIVKAMQIKLTMGEESYLVQKWPCSENLECYLKYLEAEKYWVQATPESVNIARRKAEEVLALCPGHI